ncbi:MAG TPA: hypothetical protein VFQ77_06160, partial [Pseudonocardiaceae bacterium]|nr:hypothetical protein [Pseudonocardiaceae bacterium]
RRTTKGPETGTPPPARTTAAPTTRTTRVDPAELDGGKNFSFLAQLYVPPGMFRSVRLLDSQTPVSYLAAPDGSWCEITRIPDASDHYTVREAGPTSLWASIETAWAKWIELDAPTLPEFGLTATPTTHHIWHHDPETGPRWTFPTPDE